MKLKIREVVVLGMLGAVMFASKEVMAALPNIHLVGVFVVSITVVFRWKALYPIYIYVLMQGFFNGFTSWWITNLYSWTLLWLAVMLIPKGMPQKWRAIICICLCGAHGFLYGTIDAPIHALFFGFGFEQTIIYIMNGIPFDVTHGISNTVLCSVLLIPLVKAMRRATGYTT